MSFGKRRPRGSRAQLRPTTLSLRTGPSSFRRRRGLQALAILISVLACATIIYGDGPPFPYRLGQRPDRDVRVKVPSFQRRDLIKTNTSRQEVADAVAPVLANDPASILAVRDQLIDLFAAASKVADPAELPERIGASWGLDRERLETIRDAVDTPPRYDDLVRRLRAAFEPLAARGVLGPNTLPEDASASDRLSIFEVDQGPELSHEVPIDRVLPERFAQPGSQVAREFAAHFTSPELGSILFSLAVEKLKGTPTLTYRDDLTNRRRDHARSQIREALDIYYVGNLLVARDQRIDEEQLALLKIEHLEANRRMSSEAKVRRAGAILGLVAALFALLGTHLVYSFPDVAKSTRRVAALCGLVVLGLGISKLLSLQLWDAEIVPVTVASMILAVAYGPPLALVVLLGLGTMTTMAVGGGLGHALVTIGGTAAGVLTLRQVRTRTKLIKVGVLSGATSFALTWAVGLWQNQALELIASDALWRGGWGVMAGFFLGGSLPFIENAFGIVTGISLLELGDITHPLLQELVRRAPGTHNHSVTVGSIAEAAAERIGADALLVRIGAYFHDIGKMLKPHYFVENQAGSTSRHAGLNPAMSTLIIIGHVKDGADLARQHHLPDRIIDLIEQHHGTTLVEYFYHEASRRSQALGEPPGAATPEGAFRYPGPKPQTKEAAILMIADASESASRALSEPNPARLEDLVDEIIRKRLRDGQFDECGLTLRDLGEIRKSLTKSLIGIYHGRVKYPEQRTA